MGYLLHRIKETYDREKAHLAGRGMSHARMVKQAVNIPELADRLDGFGPRIARPITKGPSVRMSDGKPMTFYSDGSLRHSLGRRVTKAARKQIKKARRAAIKKSA